MSLESLVADYGYAGVLIGTFLEGDIALVLGGLFAHWEYLKLPGVIVAALIGALVGDQFFFHLGRAKGLQVLNRFPFMKPRAERVFSKMRQHGTLIAFAFRFCYGFRIITPLLIGASGVRRGRFLLLNSLGALTWATVVASLGYMLGEALTALLQQVKPYRLPVLGTLVAMVAFGHLIAWQVRRRARRKCGCPQQDVQGSGSQGSGHAADAPLNPEP